MTGDSERTACGACYDWLKGSRFADKYIRENYDVVPMTGKRGGGFIFDTNAIHKGRKSEEK